MPPVSLQQRSYHQGWSVRLYGVDGGRWFCVIEMPRQYNASIHFHADGATIEEAIDKAWARANERDEPSDLLREKSFGEVFREMVGDDLPGGTPSS